MFRKFRKNEFRKVSQILFFAVLRLFRKIRKASQFFSKDFRNFFRKIRKVSVSSFERFRNSLFRKSLQIGFSFRKFRKVFKFCNGQFADDAEPFRWPVLEPNTRSLTVQPLGYSKPIFRGIQAF